LSSFLALKAAQPHATQHLSPQKLEQQIPAKLTSRPLQLIPL